jgi:hypothetical protein
MYPSTDQSATREKIIEIARRLIKLGIPPARAMEAAVKIAKRGMEGLSQEDTGPAGFADLLQREGRPMPKLPPMPGHKRRTIPKWDEMPRDIDKGFYRGKPKLSPDATRIPHHLDINPLRTMEFRDRNQDGIEDRSQGIYDEDRDFIPWEFDKGRKWERDIPPEILEQYKKHLSEGAPEFATGGRIGYDVGGPADQLEKALAEDDIAALEEPFSLPPLELLKLLEEIRAKKRRAYEQRQLGMTGIGAAQGGRIGYRGGKGVESLPVDQMQGNSNMQMATMDEIALEFEQEFGYDLMLAEPELREWYIKKWMDKNFYEKSQAPGRDRVMAQEGGLMDLGGMEKDYRQEGGFVPIGAKEKADDVPARLSKNEFVFTADAVRNAGGGDIDKGAAVMENLMENLEAGGKVSEESQGLEGARAMFANTKKIENRII